MRVVSIIAPVLKSSILIAHIRVLVDGVVVHAIRVAIIWIVHIILVGAI